MPALNPQTVLESSKCFACLGASLADLFILVLWDDISQGGGTPVDPYDGKLVYTRQGLGTTTVVNPGGAFNLTFALNKVTEVHCHNCPLITGITLDNSGVLTVVDFLNCPSLADWHMDNCDALTSLNLSFIQTGGTITVISCDLLSTINLSGLQTVVRLSITENPVVSLSFPALTSASMIFFIYNCASLTSLSAPVLASVNEFIIRQNSAMVSYSFPALVTIDAEFEMYLCTSLTSALFPALQFFGSLNMASCPALTTFNLPSLLSPLIQWASNDCTSLSTISFNGSPLSDSVTFNSTSCALNQSTVDLILAAGVSGGITSEYIDLSGGTSSPPSAAGLINKGILLGNGVNVATN